MLDVPQEELLSQMQLASYCLKLVVSFQEPTLALYIAFQTLLSIAFPTKVRTIANYLPAAIVFAALDFLPQDRQLHLLWVHLQASLLAVLFPSF